MLRLQLLENSSFIIIYVQRFIIKETVKNDHVTCDVTLGYFGVEIEVW